MKKRVYSVTEFNKNLKYTIEDNPLFSNFFLKGEMSGVTYYKSGHLYFTLKDDKTQIRCAAFNYKLKKIQEDLKEGDQIEIFCDLGLYEERGEIQILVRHILKLDQLGDKFLKLERLKKEMSDNGFFSPLLKKRLPKYLKNIGIVTSYTGAALQDMIKTIRKRDDRINIYVYPAKVQGHGASEEIVKGIEALDKIGDIDLIIAGRGGGSIEDLWCFNEKNVAMAFFNCKKPIISAVGHETDNLLSDLTADVRAATPTQAIEIAVTEKRYFIKESLEKKIKLKKIILIKIDRYKKELEVRYNSHFIKNFSKSLEKNYREIARKEDKLREKIELLISKKEGKLELAMEKIISRNPIKLIQKGYSKSRIFRVNKALKETLDVELGDVIETEVKDGVIISKVKDIIKK